MTVFIVCIKQLIEYLIVNGTVVTGDYYKLNAAWQTLKLNYNSETAWFYSSIDTGDSTDSGTTSGGGNSGQGKKKTYQRVEILKIAEPCPLIDPSQVVVTQGEILRADPVLTPIGTYCYCVLNSLITFEALFSHNMLICTINILYSNQKSYNNDFWTVWINHIELSVETRLFN